MEDKGTAFINAFDSHFTTGKIQMLKILSSRLAPSMIQGLAVYIKFLELKHTLSTPPLPEYGSPLPSPDKIRPENMPAIQELLEELLPFGSPAEKEKILFFKNMLSQFQQMQQMMEMMDMMKELFPEGTQSGNPSDLFSSLSGMEGMDFSALFQMFDEKK